MQNTASVPASSQYALTSDLARLCLPAATRDSNRKLAYTNSICLLFLLIGLIGLKMPQPYVRPLPEVVDIVPVVFTPPDQPPPQSQDQPQEQPEETTEPSLDAPVVATVVAADASAVKFAVPVSGPVILAPARFASAPPPQTTRQSSNDQPKRYVASVEDWIGGKSAPAYPAVAQRNRYEGKCSVLVVVDATGAVQSASIQEKSGYKLLDDAAVEHVQKYFRLRNPPGETRSLILPFIWQLR